MQGKQVIATQMKLTLYEDIKKLQKRLKQHPAKIDGYLIHAIRVVCKRVRAELVLLKSKSIKLQLKKTSKEIGKELSGIRDAEVMLSTFDSLFPQEDLTEPLKVMRAGLVKELDLQRVDQERVRSSVDRLRRQVKKCSFHQQLNAYYKKSVRRAENLCRKRLEDLDIVRPETYHEYRKSVKAYLFLLKLSQAVNKDKLMLVKRMAEELGLLHDLHLLEAAVNSYYQEQREAIEDVLRSRERVLLQNIHQAASDVFDKAVFHSSETG